jgi:hypothetical protein
MYEDTYPWPIKCHICLNEFTVEVGRMKAEKELRSRLRGQTRIHGETV